MEGPFTAYIDTIKECVEGWYSLNGTEKIVEHVLCAKHPNIGNSTCHGDSGGPLTVKQNGKHILVGITSYGYGCGLVSSPLAPKSLVTHENWFAHPTHPHQTLSLY